MKLHHALLVACALAAFCSPLPPAHAAPLAIKFKNTSGLADSQVYIGFIGGEPLTATNKATGAPLAKSEFGHENWYTLDTLAQGVDLASFSGRIYVGYGAPWNFTHAGYEPSPVNPSDPNAHKRYDKVEITYHGNASDVANATSFGVAIYCAYHGFGYMSLAWSSIAGVAVMFVLFVLERTPVEVTAIGGAAARRGLEVAPHQLGALARGHFAHEAGERVRSVQPVPVEPIGHVDGLGHQQGTQDEVPVVHEPVRAEHTNLVDE